MSISPGFSSSLGLLCLVMLGVAACSGSAIPTATATPEPTVTRIPITANSLPSGTPEADSIWLEQPFGKKDTLAVLFYTDSSGQKCVRYLVSTPGAQPVSGCSVNKESMAAVQGVEKNSEGEIFSIIVGRVPDDRPTVVSLEMDVGEAIPAPVDGYGFIVILPGHRTAKRAVPIDQFGNIAGEIFKF